MTTPEFFINAQLSLIRKTFFAKLTDKQFFQERDLLRLAITHPARWLDDRAVELPIERHRAILETVIDTIKRHGNRAKIERISVYLLHCVQEHMKHHGDEYYYEAKAPKTFRSLVPEALKGIKPGGTDRRVTEVLAGVNRALAGRRHKPKSVEAQLSLI